MKSYCKSNRLRKSILTAFLCGVLLVSAGVVPTKAAQTQNGSWDYILPDSSYRVLTSDEISSLDTYWRQMAINEIYARHGRLFDWPEVQQYFNGKAWYTGVIAPQDFNVDVFSQVEAQNIMLLKTSDSSYICPDSSSRLLTNNEINALDSQKKQMAVNEIYARHGRLFTTPQVQTYFNGKSWYQGSIPPESFSESVFSQIELWNINFLSQNTYIFPDSSQRYLTDADIQALDDEKKQMAINEIYARHGRKFDLPEMQQFFSGKSWYIGTVESWAFDSSVFNQVEQSNIVYLNQNISQAYKDQIAGYQTPARESQADIRQTCRYIQTVGEFDSLYSDGYVDFAGTYALSVYVWASYPENRLYYADFQEEGGWLTNGDAGIKLIDCRSQEPFPISEGGTLRVYGRLGEYDDTGYLTFYILAADKI